MRELCGKESNIKKIRNNIYSSSKDDFMWITTPFETEMAYRKAKIEHYFGVNNSAPIVDNFF